MGGLITAVIINGKMDGASYSAFAGYAHLGAGLTVGMSSLAAGLAIGIVGDAGVRANAQQQRLFVGMILILSSRRPWVFMDSSWASSCRPQRATRAATSASPGTSEHWVGDLRRL